MRSHLAGLWVCLSCTLAGCSVNGLQPDDDDATPSSTSDDDSAQQLADDDDSGTTPPEELCDGLDNDGDGEIDEGFPDVDEDGVADCVDGTCGVQLLTQGVVEVDAGCVDLDPVAYDFWTPEVQWQRFPPTPYFTYEVDHTPIVANTNDDNGDGLVNDDDNPDVVVVAHEGSVDKMLEVLDGTTGQQQWSWYPPHSFAGGVSPVVADVEGDGAPDLFVFDVENPTNTNYLHRLNGAGQELWSSPSSCEAQGLPKAIDFDQDGVAEVAAGCGRYWAETGEQYETFERAVVDEEPVGLSLLPVDLDADSVPDLLTGLVARSGAEPGILWEFELPDQVVPTPSWGYTAEWAVLQADADPEPELVLLVDGWFFLLDHEGNVLVEEQLGHMHPGPPCVADFDGDGWQDIAWGSGMDDDLENPPFQSRLGTLQVATSTGTLIWQDEIQDAGFAGCSAFDFDGDGAYEVVFADEETMTIRDGSTGATLYAFEDHTSGTAWEAPAIADIDKDGSAEIIFASSHAPLTANQAPFGLTVLGHPDGAWRGTGHSWQMQGFNPSAINPDNSIPTSPQPAWLTPTPLRSRPPLPGVPRPDLAVSITDSCLASCEPGGQMSVAVQVENGGAEATDTEVEVLLFTRTEGVRELVGSYTLPAGLDAGVAAEGHRFDFVLGGTLPEQLIALVDGPWASNGVAKECDEGNNAASVVVDFPCP